MGHVGFFTDSLLRSRTKAASNRIWRVSTDFVFVSHLVRFNSHCIVKKKGAKYPVEPIIYMVIFTVVSLEIVYTFYCLLQTYDTLL